MYFDQLLGARLQLFNLLCSIQSFFSDFTAEITKKVWNWTKKRVFVYSWKLVDMQKLVNSLRGYLEFVIFRWIFRTKKVEKRQKKGFEIHNTLLQGPQLLLSMHQGHPKSLLLLFCYNLCSTGRYAQTSTVEGCAKPWSSLV